MPVPDHTPHLAQHPIHHQHPDPPPHAALVIYLILLTLIGAQLALVWWKHAHQRSYDLVSLIGLWLIPGFISFHFHAWPFLMVWTLFSVITLYMFYLCMRSNKLDPSTPRLVFSWFLYSHNISIAVGAAGYALFLLELLGASPLVRAMFGKDTSFILLFYGLYFGVLGRDTAEVASTGLAATMSFGRKLSVNPHICALCNKPLQDDSHLGGEKPPEPTIQLPCKHLFHELCIKGWTMVGKKDTCPTCMEKTDLKALYADRPWETRNLQWNGMLDFVRYMVVWVPVIVTTLQVFLHLLHLDLPEEGVGGQVPAVPGIPGGMANVTINATTPPTA